MGTSYSKVKERDNYSSNYQPYTSPKPPSPPACHKRTQGQHKHHTIRDTPLPLESTLTTQLLKDAKKSQ